MVDLIYMCCISKVAASHMTNHAHLVDPHALYTQPRVSVVSMTDQARSRVAD